MSKNSTTATNATVEVATTADNSLESALLAEGLVTAEDLAEAQEVARVAAAESYKEVGDRAKAAMRESNEQSKARKAQNTEEWNAKRAAEAAIKEEAAKMRASYIAAAPAVVVEETEKDRQIAAELAALQKRQAELKAQAAARTTANAVAASEAAYNEWLKDYTPAKARNEELRAALQASNEELHKLELANPRKATRATSSSSSTPRAPRTESTEDSTPVEVTGTATLDPGQAAKLRDMTVAPKAPVKGFDVDGDNVTVYVTCRRRDAGYYVNRFLREQAGFSGKATIANN